MAEVPVTACPAAVDSPEAAVRAAAARAAAASEEATAAAARAVAVEEAARAEARAVAERAAEASEEAREGVEVVWVASTAAGTCEREVSGAPGQLRARMVARGAGRAKAGVRGCVY